MKISNFEDKMSLGPNKKNQTLDRIYVERTTWFIKLNDPNPFITLKPIFNLEYGLVHEKLGKILENGVLYIISLL